MDEPTSSAGTVLRKGQFGHPETAIQPGRMKGSKNKINAVKILLEQAVLEDNRDKIAEVMKKVIEDALEGDFRCRKLVWDSVMSKGITEAVKTAEKVEIKVGLFKQDDKTKDIEAEATVVDADYEEAPNE